jgi:hypothetical protein
MEKVFNLLLYVLIAAGVGRVHRVLLPLHFLLPLQVIPGATAEAEPQRTSESCGRNRLLSGKLLAEFRGKLNLLFVVRSVNSTFVLYGRGMAQGPVFKERRLAEVRKPLRPISGLRAAQYRSCGGIPPSGRSDRTNAM